MHFAKIENNTPVEFPISEQDLRKTLSSISLPTTINPSALEGLGYVCVRSGRADETPTPNLTHAVALVGCVSDPDTDGYWKPLYELQQAEPSESNRRIRKQLALIRNKRKVLFDELDVMINRALREQRLGLTATIPLANLDAYGKLLAEVTDQPDIFNITWPVLER